MELYEKYGVCGYLMLEGRGTEIYVNSETGDLLYKDDVTGRSMMIGGISDQTARTTMDAKALSKKLNAGAYGEGVIGVVYCQERVLVLTSEDTLEVRAFSKVSQPSDKEYEITLDLDAEE